MQTKSNSVLKYLIPVLKYLLLSAIISISQSSERLFAQTKIATGRSLFNAVLQAEQELSEQKFPQAILTLTQALDSANETENKSDAIYLLCNIAFIEGRYDLILEQSKKFTWLYSTDYRASDITFLRGVSAYLLKKSVMAKEAFEKVILQNKTKVAEAYYWKARLFAEENQLDSLQANVDKSIELSPHLYSDYALYLSAWLNEFKNKNDTAAALYRVLLNDYENSSLTLDAQMRLAIIAGRRGSYSSAFTLLDSLLPNGERQKEERLFMLGELANSLENYQDVVKYRRLFLINYPKSKRLKSCIYSMGYGFLQLKKYDSALVYFNKLQQDKDSLSSASNYQIATAKLLSGDTVGAVKFYENLINRFSQGSFTDNAYYRLGTIFYTRQMYDSARHYLLYLTKQYPKSEVRGQGQYLLGESYARLNDPNNAYFAFSRVRKIDSTSELCRKSLYREGVMLYLSGRFRSASDRFREYLEKYSKSEDVADATYWLADAVFMTGAFKEAELYYRNYLTNYKNKNRAEDAMYGLAWALFKQKNVKDASEAFADFIRAYPKGEQTVEAIIRLADCKRIFGENDTALVLYKKAILLASMGNQNEESRFRYAEVLLKLGDTISAITAIQELVKDYPASPRKELYAINIPTIYKNANNDSVAIIESNAFVALYPNSNLVPQAYLIKADAYFNKTLYDTALFNYTLILDKFPQSHVIPDALDGARFSLEKLGRSQEALTVIDSFEIKNPNRIAGDSLLYRRAIIFTEQGNYAEGIGATRRLEQKFPESKLVPEARLLGAKGFYMWGKSDSAFMVYQSVIDSFPNTEPANNAVLEQSNILANVEKWSEVILKLEPLTRKQKTYSRLPEARYLLGKAYLNSSDTAQAAYNFNSVLELKKIFDQKILNDTTIIDSGRIDEDDIVLTAKEDAKLDYFTDKSRNALAKILLKQSKIDSAISLTKLVISRRLDDAAVEAYLIQAECLMKNRDYITTITILKKLIKDFSNYSEQTEPAYILIGSSYESLGEIISAREIYNKLLAITKNEKLKTEVNNRLKRIKKR